MLNLISERWLVALFVGSDTQDLIEESAKLRFICGILATCSFRFCQVFNRTFRSGKELHRPLYLNNRAPPKEPQPSSRWYVIEELRANTAQASRVAGQALTIPSIRSDTQLRRSHRPNLLEPEDHIYESASKTPARQPRPSMAGNYNVQSNTLRMCQNKRRQFQ